MTVATGNAAQAADVVAIQALATSASTAASVATANAATALSNSVAAQAAAEEAGAMAAVALSATSNPGQHGLSSYVFAQDSPSAEWVIVHNMNCYPVVVVVDSTGGVTEGDIAYDSSSQVTLTFSAALAGTAYLN